MTVIDDFLKHKRLSANSLSAYRYDLEQFRQVVAGDIDITTLAQYQQFLRNLKPSAQKRKISAVNQFLYYLYDSGHLKTYHRLSGLSQPILEEKTVVEQLDFSQLWLETPYQKGQVLALLILTLGLLPSEILALEAKDLNLEYGVLAITKAEHKRVLKLPDSLFPYLEGLNPEGFLFGKGPKPYSRQWFFTRFREFMSSVGYGEVTAQKLREQYIVRQVASGESLTDIAKALGLKTVASLAKYQYI
ncbi:integrase [Streptococcus rupicaprae]|uniref:Integrase n=1 Tax=Streptococcus rupicaprae TaxID=759619 RepID=A0ABV2FKR4_9STRE